MSTIDDISNGVVRDICALSPLTAAYLGRPSDLLMDDFSPEGVSEQAEVARQAVRAAEAVEPADAAERVARDVLLERLQLHVDRHDAGHLTGELNVIASPLQVIRMMFDLLPAAGTDDAADQAARMAEVPTALDGYRRSLQAAADSGHLAAVRQVDKCAEQCDTYGGVTADHGFFAGHAEALIASTGADEALADRLRGAAISADAAYADLGRFLRDEMRPHAPASDAVGEEHYALASRDFLGAAVDLRETYEWGWEEFLSLEAELIDVSKRISAGATPRQAADLLDDDERYQVVGTDGLQRWMQELSDGAIAELGRTHFDIPEPLRTLNCKIAPPGGGVGAYYTGPNEDFSRPGAMWWSVEPGREVFSTWRETTTVYHEGVPGHHLQIGTAVHQRDRLNDFQRLMAGTSGHAEGWALYAERLVRELGYLDNDGDLLGMLDAQIFRAARVIIDIGMHLELAIPAGTGFHDGERWTPALGQEFMLTRTISDPAHVADEIDRYLGWPGQAPSYKVGERIWIDGRDAARRRHGDDFDPRDFHTRALQFGEMGLAPLGALLATL